jgi:hypothetical protein
MSATPSASARTRRRPDRPREGGRSRPQAGSSRAGHRVQDSISVEVPLPSLCVATLQEPVAAEKVSTGLGEAGSVTVVKIVHLHRARSIRGLSGEILIALRGGAGSGPLLVRGTGQCPVVGVRASPGRHSDQHPLQTRHLMDADDLRATDLPECELRAALADLSPCPDWHPPLKATLRARVPIATRVRQWFGSPGRL